MTPSNSSPETVVKTGRPRGRRKNTINSTYKKVLVDADTLAGLIESINSMPPKPHLTEQERQAEKLFKYDRIDHILNHPQAAEYYWRMVFSLAIYNLSEAMEKKIPAKTNRPAKLKLKALAAEVGLNYHNFKTICMGKGYSAMLLRFQLFLERYDVALGSLATHDVVVEKAHLYFLVLTRQ